MSSPRRVLTRACSGLLSVVCLAVSAAPSADPAWPSAPLLLLGEQHDAAEHQQLATQTVRRLASQGRLQALAVEMAERGHDTRALAADADEATVRERLAWNERGWPWAAYGPIVMAAVRAGVPVLGANLPRAEMRAAMMDARWDDTVPAAVRDLLLTDVRDGHCGLLPEAQLPGMVRIQIARDAAMAQALLDSAPTRPDHVAMLIAGSNHVARDRGVPVHLRRLRPDLALEAVEMRAGAAPGADRAFDTVWSTPPVQRPDPCEALRERWRARPPGG